MPQAQARGNFTIRLDSKNAGELREFVPHSRGTRFLEDNGNVLALDSVELNGDQSINSILRAERDTRPATTLAKQEARPRLPARGRYRVTQCVKTPNPTL
jgi:hypothetical protein